MFGRDQDPRLIHFAELCQYYITIMLVNAAPLLSRLLSRLAMV